MATNKFHSWNDWRDMARKKVPKFVFDFIDGGAGNEAALNRNIDLFKQISMVPRVLKNNSHKKITINILGNQCGFPIAIAPTGLNGLIKPRGDQLIAQAAAANNIPFILSTAANCSIEQIISKTGVCPWIQLYVINKAGVLKLVEKIREKGCEILVITIDVPVSGNRLRDLKNGFKMPLRPNFSLIADCLNRPQWSIARMMDKPLSFPLLESDSSFKAKADRLFSRNFDSLSWNDITRIRDQWPGKLILKGILHPDDAVEAVRIGLDGVVISNHGGRQLENTVTPLEMLPSIVSVVKNKLAVFLDGGVRSGEDILKAIALGADSVLVGRLPLYGLAAGGESGVSEVISMLETEMTNSMALLGCNSLEDVRKIMIVNRCPSISFN
jgi:(S)-mandelate dehydrogenase